MPGRDVNLISRASRNPCISDTASIRKDSISIAESGIDDMRRYGRIVPLDQGGLKSNTNRSSKRDERNEGMPDPIGGPIGNTAPRSGIAGIHGRDVGGEDQVRMLWEEKGRR